MYLLYGLSYGIWDCLTNGFCLNLRHQLWVCSVISAGNALWQAACVPCTWHIGAAQTGRSWSAHIAHRFCRVSGSCALRFIYKCISSVNILASVCVCVWLTCVAQSWQQAEEAKAAAAAVENQSECVQHFEFEISLPALALMMMY